VEGVTEVGAVMIDDDDLVLVESSCPDFYEDELTLVFGT
jgi:hypothetical protein